MKRSGKQVHKRYNYLSNLRIDRQLISHHICYMADEEMVMFILQYPPEILWVSGANAQTAAACGNMFSN